MIIQFSLGNYLSFKDTVTLSMVASNSVRELEGDETDSNNVFHDPEHKVKCLKSTVIYGANNSGKSNLITALSFFRRFVLTSSNARQAEDEIDITPFLLSTETEQEPSEFEIIFMIDQIRYRYGFETTRHHIVSEWLFVLDTQTTIKESYCFVREEQDIKINIKYFKEGKGLEANTRPNALFLSTVAQLNGATAIKLQNWFRNEIRIMSGMQDTTTQFTIEKFQENIAFRKRVVDFMKLIDVGIEDIRIEEKALSELMSEMALPNIEDKKLESLLTELQKVILEKIGDHTKRTEIKVNSYHKKYDEANRLINLIRLEFGSESVGTRKLFGLLGPWFDAIENGKTLIIDELDCSLHTKLTIELIKLFQSKINTKNAQLVFASHDTNLLRRDLFRRDQIWFTEKNNETGSSDLYSLVEYKINQASSVRNDASFEKDYLLGKYGAIPYFGNIAQFINDYTNDIENG